MHKMEHRWGNRVWVGRRVRLRGSGVAGIGLLLEASLSGGLVRTNLKVPLLSRVEIELETSGESYKVSATIVRHQHGQLALEWNEFAPDAVIAVVGGCAPVGRLTAKIAEESRAADPGQRSMDSSHPKAAAVAYSKSR